MHAFIYRDSKYFYFRLEPNPVYLGNWKLGRARPHLPRTLPKVLGTSLHEAHPRFSSTSLLLMLSNSELESLTQRDTMFACPPSAAALVSSFQVFFRVMKQVACPINLACGFLIIYSAAVLSCSLLSSLCWIPMDLSLVPLIRNTATLVF